MYSFSNILEIMLEIMLPFIVGKVKRLRIPIFQVLLLVLWSSTGTESAFTKGELKIYCLFVKIMLKVSRSLNY